MVLYQLIHARCNPSFKIDKKNKEKFYTNGLIAGYGWFSISKGIINNSSLLYIADDIAHRLMDNFAQNGYNATDRKVTASFSYTRVSVGGNIFPVWAYLYIQNDDRGSAGKHFLVGDGTKGIAPCRIITGKATCWNDSYYRNMYDANLQREYLPEIEVSAIDNLLPEPFIDQNYFTPKKKKLLSKVLCFAMEQIRLINYDKQPAKARTLIIKEIPENTRLWVNAITHLLCLKGMPDYAAVLTFSTNVSDISFNSSLRLFNEKEGDAPYFMIAGAHPSDYSVNFGSDGERYLFLDPEKDDFNYNSPDFENPYFADIMQNEAKIEQFWQTIEGIENPKDVLCKYYWHSLKDNIDKIEYKEALRIFKQADADDNIKKELRKNAGKFIKREDLFQEDLFQKDIENRGSLVELMLKIFPVEAKKDIFSRQFNAFLASGDYDNVKTLIVEKLKNENFLPDILQAFITFIENSENEKIKLDFACKDRKEGLPLFFSVEKGYGKEGFAWKVQKDCFELQKNENRHKEIIAFLKDLPYLAKTRPSIKKEILNLEKSFFENDSIMSFVSGHEEEYFPLFADYAKDNKLSKNIFDNIALLLISTTDIEQCSEKLNLLADKGLMAMLKTLVRYAEKKKNENLRAAILLSQGDEFLYNELQKLYAEKYRIRFESEIKSINLEQMSFFNDKVKDFIVYLMDKDYSLSKKAIFLAAYKAYVSLFEDKKVCEPELKSSEENSQREEKNSI